MINLYKILAQKSQGNKSLANDCRSVPDGAVENLYLSHFVQKDPGVHNVSHGVGKGKVFPDA
jgi:hypothetical protein